MPNLSDVSSEYANDADDAEMFQSSKNNNNVVEPDWQSVRIKRKRIEYPQHNNKRINIHDVPSTSSNNNRYSDLDTNDEEADGAHKPIPKPSAIYIPNVENINLMVKKLSEVVSATDFSYKSLMEDQVRLMSKSVDSYI